MSKKGNEKKLTKDDFKDVILSDFRLVNEVRESSLLGRRDVLSMIRFLEFFGMEKN